MKLPIKISLGVSIISIVFMLLLFNNIHNQLIQAKKEYIVEKSIEDLEDLKKHIDLIINKAKNTLTTITITDISAQDTITKQKFRFELYMKDISEIRELKYISLEGDQLLSVSNKTIIENIDKKSYLNENSFITSLKDKVYISDIYFTKNDNEMMIDIAQGVTDITTQKISAVIIAKISMASIQDIISDKLIDFDGIALLNQKTDKFLYKSSHAKDISNNDFFSLTSTINTISKDEHSHLLVSSEYNNLQLKLKLFLLTKESSLFYEIENTINKNLQLLALIILFSTIITYLLISNTLKPIEKLIKDVKTRSSKIDNKFDTNTKSSLDEVDEMKYYFDIFIKLIEHDKERLKNFNSTLQEKVDQEIQKNQEKEKLIARQSKLAALGEMMDAIAHQWKQPLSIIGINIQNLNMRVMLNEDITPQIIQETSDETQKQILHLVSTIDEFREFFRPNQELSTINIKSMISSTLELMDNELMKNNIKYEIIGNDKAEISCIKNEFKHVFINLINNSKDAFIENGIQNRKMIFNILKENDKTVIKIYDNAGGIPEKYINNIFISNFTTKKDGEGTGIGLYLTKQIIEKLDATIEVANVNNGVCFTIKL
ncbi:MAG: HAMP domain-containing sensor histidine kinase [Campylobacterota bacterium]|nr:HAMP domain-containing sensor histidine kinase [Campylobacterota bacterium]